MWNPISSAIDKVSDLGSKVGEKVSDLASTARSKVSDFASTAGGKVADFGSFVGGNTKSFLDTVGTKTGVKDLGSSVKEKITDFRDYDWGDKIDSAGTIVGTNIKNSFSAENIATVAGGFATGGLAGGMLGIAQAAANTSIKSMQELDKSGKYNSEYAWKQTDFPSKESYELAISQGIDSFEKWKEFCKKNYITIDGKEDTEAIEKAQLELAKSKGFPTVEMAKLAGEYGCDTYDKWVSECKKYGVDPKTGKRDPLLDVLSEPEPEPIQSPIEDYYTQKVGYVSSVVPTTGNEAIDNAVNGVVQKAVSGENPLQSVQDSLKGFLNEAVKQNTGHSLDEMQQAQQFKSLANADKGDSKDLVATVGMGLLAKWLTK